MKELEPFTLKYVSDYIIAKISKEFSISKQLARALFINAISYNVVMDAIGDQVAYLLEDD